MTKRIGGLYSQIYDMDNLRRAHLNARKGKGWYEEVKLVDLYPEFYLSNLQKQLIKHTYKTSSYEKFIKKEGHKLRTIYKLPYFPDRIAQWAIIQVIEKYLLKNFTTDTYSSIPNMGIHKALFKLQKVCHNDTTGTMYCLKLDIRHFYQNINHKILKEKYRKIFKDKELLNILDEVIDSISTAEEEDLKNFYGESLIDWETGIPIGNYLSQYSGNLYLSSFDHWIKEVLKVKYYFRYMDDIIILHSSKVELHKIKEQIASYLNSKLRLTLKSNWQIFPTSKRGIDFVGYRVFPDYTLLRKTTAKHFKKKMVKIRKKVQFNNQLMNYSDWCSINSYKGWLLHCDSYHLYTKYVLPLEIHSNRYYNIIIRGDKNEILS